MCEIPSDAGFVGSTAKELAGRSGGGAMGELGVFSPRARKCKVLLPGSFLEFRSLFDGLVAAPAL